MTHHPKRQDDGWQNALNTALSVFALVLGGFTIALLFLLTPVLFLILIAAYCIKFLLQIWAWQKTKPHTVGEQFTGLHFFNYNRALSARFEWAIVLLAFAATIVWIKVLARVIFS